MKKYNYTKKKTNKKHGDDVERAFVDILVKNIEILDSNISCMVDTDSAARVFKSKYDLQLVRNSRSVYIEAKRTKFTTVDKMMFKPSNDDGFLDIWSKLRDEQKIGCSMLNLSGTPYYIVHFKTATEHKTTRVLADVFRVTSRHLSASESIREIKLIDYNVDLLDLAHYFFEAVYDA